MWPWQRILGFVLGFLAAFSGVLLVLYGCSDICHTPEEGMTEEQCEKRGRHLTMPQSTSQVGIVVVGIFLLLGSLASLVWYFVTHCKKQHAKSLVRNGEHRENLRESSEDPELGSDGNEDSGDVSLSDVSSSDSDDLAH